MRMSRTGAPVLVLALAALSPLLLASTARASSPNPALENDYLLLATSKTSTMQEEMTEAAEAGYRFKAVMGGGTAFGGSEVVVIMSRGPDADPGRFQYRLLATSKTSTMQEELQEAGDAGFEYMGQTVFNTTFGGDEVVVILERDRDVTPTLYEYRLLATSRTSTMQEELREAAASGFEFVGLTVSQTTFGGSEVVSILRRLAGQ